MSPLKAMKSSFQQRRLLGDKVKEEKLDSKVQEKKNQKTHTTLNWKLASNTKEEVCGEVALMCLRLDPCNASGFSFFSVFLSFYPFKACENHKRALMIHQMLLWCGSVQVSVDKPVSQCCQKESGEAFETLYLSHTVMATHFFPLPSDEFWEIKASSAGLLIPSSAPLHTWALPKLGDSARVSCAGLELLRRTAPRQWMKPNVPQ